MESLVWNLRTVTTKDKAEKFEGRTLLHNFLTVAIKKYCHNRKLTQRLSQPCIKSTSTKASAQHLSLQPGANASDCGQDSCFEISEVSLCISALKTSSCFNFFENAHSLLWHPYSHCDAWQIQLLCSIIPNECQYCLDNTALRLLFNLSKRFWGHTMSSCEIYYTLSLHLVHIWVREHSDSFCLEICMQMQCKYTHMNVILKNVIVTIYY